MKELQLNAKQLTACRKKIVQGIRNTMNAAKAKGVVVGLSGGVDSSTVAKLATEAVKDVYGLMLPEKQVNDPRDLKDAERLAEQLGIDYSVIEIDEIVNAISEKFHWESHNTRGKKKAIANIKPRVRMTCLYLAANLDYRLVLGTGNKTELLLGYFTKHGDGACDLLPIGDLYKTQLAQLARHIGVPDAIVDKVPSAGLWKGQTDEAEIGLKYSELDSILSYLVEHNLSIDDTVKKTGLDKNKVEGIASRVVVNEHKRNMPATIKI